ncbi:MAG: Fic family protein [Spirochaetaceae bacterium]|nr:Fic family protein [Spirochaetaceae bacterium]
MITAGRAGIVSWIHERGEWPEFIWDDAALARPLAEVRYRQGRHLGKMEALAIDLRTEANVLALTDEVVRSSAIEGEHLDPVEVRSSVARQLGLDVGGLPMPGREVEGVVAMALDATSNFDRPLTAERLFGWHAALFPTGRTGITRITVGAWRTDKAGPMRVVSGPMGKERLHFQAPAASRLADEMDRFLEWFESSSIDPVLKAGVAHFWFVTIHPFDDGNGRIGRAIAEMALSRADGTKERYYSMSSAIEARRKEYYRQLESGQRGGLDITAWLAWFLGCLDRTIQHADERLASVLFKASLWQRINEEPVNERQRTIINRLLGDFEGHLTTSKYARIAKCSNDTALRDIRELLARGIIVRNPAGGRSTSYRLQLPAAKPDSQANAERGTSAELGISDPDVGELEGQGRLRRDA